MPAISPSFFRPHSTLIPAQSMLRFLKTTACLLVTALLPLPSWSAEPAHQAPIAALYETHIVPKDRSLKPMTKRWYFWRDGDRVEVRDVDGHAGERWERDPSGKVFYARLYHEDRAQIEFGPTEFQASGSSWAKAAALIEPAWLGTTLKQTKTIRAGAYPVQDYRGKAEGGQIKLLWRPDLTLPAEIRGDYPDKITRLRLIRSWSLEQAPHGMTSPAQLESYRLIDGADLGDMESDPLVMRVLNDAGHHHTH